MWLTDRSRYVTGLQDCPRLRYLRYHAGPHGYGMNRTRTAIPLATGTYIHMALADILLTEQKGSCGRSEARRAILGAVSAYRKQVAAQPLNGTYLDPGEPDFIADEQACLIEGLCWAWYRIMLPIIRAEFTIVEVEREEAVVFGCSCGASYPGPSPPDKHEDVCSGIVLMSRPDCLLRRNEDGVLTNNDFKTASSMSDSKMEEWRQSIQMVMGSIGAEIRLGEPIPHFYMHALIKGGRGIFKKKGQEPLPYRRTYSHLCYAKIIPPSPPATRKPMWSTTKGYWYDRSPIWQYDFDGLGKDPDMSNSEHWVMELLDTETLNDCFQLVGPYDRNTDMVESFSTELVEEEIRWINKLNELYEIEIEHPWDTAVFQRELNKSCPRSYNCTTYGSRCSMYDLCFFQTGWENPFLANKYEHRRSHHEPEVVQMKARGVILPLCPWEDAEEEEGAN